MNKARLPRSARPCPEQCAELAAIRVRSRLRAPGRAHGRERREHARDDSTLCGPPHAADFHRAGHALSRARKARSPSAIGKTGSEGASRLRLSGRDEVRRAQR
jgi:hypothetical protein